jgi:hypothetical protein
MPIRTWIQPWLLLVFAAHGILRGLISHKLSTLIWSLDPPSKTIWELQQPTSGRRRHAE